MLMSASGTISGNLEPNCDCCKRKHKARVQTQNFAAIPQSQCLKKFLLLSLSLCPGLRHARIWSCMSCPFAIYDVSETRNTCSELQRNAWKYKIPMDWRTSYWICYGTPSLVPKNCAFISNWVFIVSFRHTRKMIERGAIWLSCSTRQGGYHSRKSWQASWQWRLSMQEHKAATSCRCQFRSGSSMKTTSRKCELESLFLC